LPNAFFVELQNDTVILDEYETRHLRVTRVRSGNRLLGLDGQGNLVDFVLEEIGDTRSKGIVLSKRHVDRDEYHLTIWVGATRWKRLRLILEKSTELGVDKIVVFQADNSAVKKTENSLDKCMKVLRDAAKQSLNPYVPALEWIFTFTRDLAADSLVLLLDIEGVSLKSISDRVSRSSTISIVVGPEGGFSQKEKRLLGASAVPVSMGSRILRVETAVISALSLVNSYVKRF